MGLEAPIGLGCRGRFKKTLLSHQTWRPKKVWQVALTQMLPASVVLATVFNGVPFEAVQLFRGMERRLLSFACQSLNE